MTARVAYSMPQESAPTPRAMLAADIGWPSSLPVADPILTPAAEIVVHSAADSPRTNH